MSYERVKQGAFVYVFFDDFVSIWMRILCHILLLLLDLSHALFLQLSIFTNFRTSSNLNLSHQNFVALALFLNMMSFKTNYSTVFE